MIVDIPDILKWSVILVAMPLNWYVTWLLFRISRADPRGRALRVTFILSLCVSMVVSVFVFIFINSDVDYGIVARDQHQILTRGTLLVLSTVPALYWLRWYRNGAEHKDCDDCDDD